MGADLIKKETRGKGNLKKQDSKPTFKFTLE